MAGTSFDLKAADFDGTNGVKITGSSNYSVSQAGDVNGDGFADFTISPPQSNVTQVVFGRAGSFGKTFDVADLNGANGFTLTTGAAASVTATAAGDVDGDGIGDLVGLVGPAERKSAYVLFGSETAGPASRSVDSLGGAAGFTVTDSSGKASLTAVASAGDVNGDGFADLLFGSAGEDVGGTDTGASYLVFGGGSGSVDLASLNGRNGVKLVGTPDGSLSGLTVASAGDVNGDGLDDLLIGAPGAYAPSRVQETAAYVVFGKTGGFDPTINLGGLDGRDGFALTRAFPTDKVGTSVASAGDINGDGFDDLLIGVGIRGRGTPDGAYPLKSAVYVVFGSGEDFSPSVGLQGLKGNNGFEITLGRNSYDVGDVVVASAGDINGDGFDDMVIGKYSYRSTGEALIVFGKAGGFTQKVGEDAVFQVEDQAIITESNGFPSLVYFDRFYLTASGAGDVNRDGFDDFLVGARVNDEASSIDNGFVNYLIYGHAGQSAGVARVGTAGGDRLTGGTGNDSLRGLAGNDTLLGLDGDDRLDGGAGADRLEGGAGNDTYRADAADTIVEAASGGIDTVQTEDGFVLPSNVENLTLLGDAAINGTGNGLANTILGNAGRNTLSGLAGNDLLDGGAGADRLVGGTGNDTYAVENVGDQVIEAVGEGNDTVVARVSYTLAAGQEIETLQLAKSTTAPNSLTGNAFANTLRGNAGANLLDGKGGVDQLYGGIGDDLYAVDNAGDRVFEERGFGDDTVVASVTYALQAGQAVETLQLASATAQASLKLFGNEFANTLRGNNGANLLDGGAGIDQLYGKAGDDTYAVDRAEDRVFEVKGEGRDAVVATVSYALQAGQEIETLQFAKSTGTKALKLTGNEFANTLLGNGGANALNGLDGSDVLSGRGGADTFTFSTKLGGGNIDRITDFGSDDTLKLEDSIFGALAPGALAASAFKNISAGKADADDHILYKQATGQLFYDADAGGKGAAVWFATLDNKAALTAADILVV